MTDTATRGPYRDDDENREFDAAQLPPNPAGDPTPGRWAREDAGNPDAESGGFDEDAERA